MLEEQYQRELAAVVAVIALIGLCVVGAFAYMELTTTHGERLSVEPADANATYDSDEVVAFEAMTQAQKRTFRAALNAESGRVEITNASSEVWTDHRAVRYRNETYEVYVLSV
jgi:isopropylmalate/homocitrate/citramalate synthase